MKEKIMRTYLKILLITGGLQILAFVGENLMDFLTRKSSTSSMLSFHAFLFCIILSTIFGIILPLKWYSSLKDKILGILLLPTNYTLLIMALVVVRGLDILVKIFQNLPSNFG